MKRSPIKMKVEPVRSGLGGIVYWEVNCPFNDCRDEDSSPWQDKAMNLAQEHVNRHRRQMSPEMLALFDNPAILDIVKKIGQGINTAFKVLNRECVCGHAAIQHREGKRCTVCLMSSQMNKCLKFRSAGVKV